MDNDDSVPILDVLSKQIYQSFLEKKQIPPSAKLSWHNRQLGERLFLSILYYIRIKNQGILI